MTSFTAVYDACVFYPASLRDLLLRAASTDLFRARWTNTIHEEWVRNLLRNRPDLSEEKLQRTISLINQSVPDCLVSNYEDLIPSLELPDSDDRHVLAAAIRCDADVIVTYNLKDFPKEILKQRDIEAQHPDTFLTHLFDLNPVLFCSVVREHRRALKNPKKTIQKMLDAYMSQGLVVTVTRLREMMNLL